MPKKSAAPPADATPVPAHPSPQRRHPWGTGEMTDGQMTGYWEWFRNAGTKMRFGSFVNCEQFGEWTTFDKTGRAVTVTTMMPESTVT